MFFPAKPGETIPKERKIHWCLRRNSRSNRHSFAVAQLPQLAQRSFKRGTSARIRSAGFNLDNLGVLPFLGNLMKPPNSYWMGKITWNMKYLIFKHLIEVCSTISRLNKSKYPRSKDVQIGISLFGIPKDHQFLGEHNFPMDPSIGVWADVWRLCPSEEYESQLGWWNSQYLENKIHVPNHQPDN